MTVLISPNIKKESVRINPNGDEIDPKTKQIIKKNETGYVPTADELAGKAHPNAITLLQKPATEFSDPMSIQAEIEATEAYLATLKAKKMEKIKEMEAQLAKLKQ